MGKEVDSSALSGVLFESSADAIVVVDADGRIVLANAACEELLGYEARARSRANPCRCSFLQGTQGTKSFAPGIFAPPVRDPMGLGLSLAARHADGREIPGHVFGPHRGRRPETHRGRPARSSRTRRGSGRPAHPGDRAALCRQRDRHYVSLGDDRLGEPCCLRDHRLRRRRAGRSAHPTPQVGRARCGLLRRSLAVRYRRRDLVGDDREPAQGRHALPRGADDRAGPGRVRGCHAFRCDQGRCERPATGRGGARWRPSRARRQGCRDRVAQRAVARARHPRPTDRASQSPILRGDRRARRGPSRSHRRAARDPGDRYRPLQSRQRPAWATPAAIPRSGYWRRS